MRDTSGPPRDTITQRLAAENRRVKEAEPEIARAYDNLVERLIESGAGASAPKVGDLLPAFVLPDDDGRLVKLSDFGDASSVVISLNRGHWCSYCRIELESMQEIYDEVRGRGGAIVAITPDRQVYARKLKERCKLTFPVLSDVDNAYAMSLDLAVSCGDEIRALYGNVSLDLSKSQGNDSWLIPIPATYIVAPNGRIKARFVDADFRRRLGPEEILNAI